MNITSKQQAFDLLENSGETMPCEAIKYLYDHEPDEEILQKIIYHLNNGYDWDMLNDDNINDALWYAIVAENHLDLRFVDALITLFSKPEYIDLDYLNEQALYLTGLLCEKFGEDAAKKIIDIIAKKVKENAFHNYLFLADALYFLDKEKYSETVLRLLDNADCPSIDFLVSEIASAGFTNILPRVKELITIFKENKAPDYKIKQLEEAILYSNNDFGKPYFKTRSDWEQHYDHFISEKGYRKRSQRIQQSLKAMLGDIGRNEPCPCGSGKKFKRCCIDKYKNIL